MNNDQLHANLKSTSESDSDQNRNELSEDNNNADLPTVRKRQKRRRKKARNDMTTQWSDRTMPVRPTNQFLRYYLICIQIDFYVKSAFH